MENEVWKDINGYEGKYAISNMGRVKSLKRIVPVICSNKSRNKKGTQTVKEKYLKQSLDKGYLRVTLSFLGKTFRRSVHILVALHFINNPDNKKYVNHKYGIKTDNRASELEWCTSSENELHSYNVLGKISGLSKGVINTKTGERFSSISKAAISIGMKPGTLLAKFNGQVKTNNTNFIKA